MAIGKILSDFSGWTSCHGVPHIGASTHWCLKSFWTLIFLVSSAMFAYQLSLLIEKYTSYPVSVSTELKFEQLTFPAVTICNLNPYKYSVVQQYASTHTAEVMDLIHSYEMAVAGNMSKSNAKWGMNEMNDTIAIQSKAKDDLVYVTAKIGDKHPEIVEQISFTKPDLLVSCAYNTLACLPSDFVKREDPVYGNCYTFNGNKTYTSNRAGPIYGLRLLLKSNQSEYLPLVESAGSRISIHDQEEDPFPDAFGYNAAAGFTTSFGISFVKTQRLQQPYGNCTSDGAGLDYYYDGSYTVEGCFRSCYQKTAQSTCGCYDPRYALPPSAGTTVKTCDITDSKQASCILNVSNPNSEDGGFSAMIACQCPQPCEERDYSVTVSNALWPSEMFTPQQCLNDQPYPGSWTDAKSCKDWYGNNTLLIEVYFERMNYQELSESPAYGIVNLISDLGGQLGLWLGASAITFVEAISLIVLICIYGCATNCGKKPPPTPYVADKGQLAQTPPPPYGGFNQPGFYGANTGPDSFIPPKPVYT